MYALHFVGVCLTVWHKILSKASARFILANLDILYLSIFDQKKREVKVSPKMMEFLQEESKEMSAKAQVCALVKSFQVDLFFLSTECPMANIPKSQKLFSQYRKRNV
jgi:hypothetical protein